MKNETNNLKNIEDKKVLNNNIKKTVSKKTSSKKHELDGKFLLVKVGTEASPASEPQILSLKNDLLKFFEDNSINCTAFVTHHAVDISVIEPGQKETYV